MAKRRKKKKPKMEQVVKEPPKTEPKPDVLAEPVKEATPVEEVELSETPVIEDEQANAPVEAYIHIPVRSAPTGPLLVKCAGCKSMVDSATAKLCPTCPKGLVFCPACAKPGSCHKCGKGLQ